MINKMRFEIMLEIPMPLTPQFSDTGSVETSNVSKVLDGEIDIFIQSNLKKGK